MFFPREQSYGEAPTDGKSLHPGMGELAGGKTQEMSRNSPVKRVRVFVLSVFTVLVILYVA